MKRTLIILGILFALVIVIVAGLIGFAAYNGTKLDASSKKYVNQAIPSIIASWSEAELLEQASPELKAIAPIDQIHQLFKKLSGLGKLKEYQGAKGSSFMAYTTKNGKRITAKYTANAIFENGTAEINIQLIDHGGQWQILSFHVNSPIFLK